MQFVENRAGQWSATPSVVRPNERVLIDPAGPVHPFRLATGSWVRERPFVVIQQESVVEAVVGVADLNPPPTAAVTVHRNGRFLAVPPQPQPNPRRIGCPDGEFRHHGPA